MEAIKDRIDELGVNWSVFADSEAEKVKVAIRNGHAEHLAAILDAVTPDKAKEIEKIQAQLRPVRTDFKSRTQQEFEIWLSTHQNELTPAIEKEWQDKIQAEKDAFVKMTAGDVEGTKVENKGGTSENTITSSNNLSDLKGIGPKSVEKLHAEGIITVEQFRKLAFEDKQRILGPLVADNFKE